MGLFNIAHDAPNRSGEPNIAAAERYFNEHL
jgi:hypothetical protein